MNLQDFKRKRNLLTAIDAHAALWLIVCGAAWSTTLPTAIKYSAAIMMLVFALLQHWAYHKLDNAPEEKQPGRRRQVTRISPPHLTL